MWVINRLNKVKGAFFFSFQVGAGVHALPVSLKAAAAAAAVFIAALNHEGITGDLSWRICLVNRRKCDTGETEVRTH